MRNIFLTRALTGLDTSRVEFAGCFVFALSSKWTFDTNATTIYSYSPRAISIAAQIRSLPVGTLYRGGLSDYSFQSARVDSTVFEGRTELRQIEPVPSGVHIALRPALVRNRGPFTPVRTPSLVGFADVIQSLASREEVMLAVKPADIASMPSTSGWLTRIQPCPAWIFQQVQMQ